MKRRHVVRGVGYGSVLLVFAIAIPGSPAYLPDLLTSSEDYEGRSARSWSRDLGSTDAEKRKDAAIALGAIGVPAKKSVPKLAALMLEDPDHEVRVQASFALTKMAPWAAEAVPALAQALSDREPLIRMNAACTIHRQGADAHAAVPALIAALKDESNEIYVDRFVLTVHEMIVLTLARVTTGTETGVAALVDAFNGARENRTRRVIARGLGQIGPPAHAAVPALLKAGNSNDWHLREAVEAALNQIAPESNLHLSEPPALAGLPEQERSYLWEIEHHGNLLVKHGFAPLATALGDNNRSSIEQMLAVDFTGSDLRDAHRVHVATKFAEVERLQDAGRPPAPLTRDGFVTRLQDLRKPFAASVPSIKLALMTLSPQKRGDLAGLWEGTAQLRLAGVYSAGAPAETVVAIQFVIRQPTQETLARPGWLCGARVMQVATSRAPAYLFAEVAKERGLRPERCLDNWKSGSAFPTTGGVYVCDFDRDGILDVLVVDVLGFALFRGSADGKFEDVTIARGLRDGVTPGQLVAAAWVDLDGDGWEDLLFGSRIYRNERGARFVDVTELSNLRLSLNSVALVAADYDRDGKLDLYVTQNARAGTGSWLVGTSSDAPGNYLIRNLGNWQFEYVTRASGASGGARSTFTAAWLDANNDGWPDLHVANEFGDGVLLVNQKNGKFVEHKLADKPADFGTMGLAVGDINNDGHIDIYCSNMYSKAGTRVIGNLSANAYPPSIMETMRRFVAGGQLHVNRGGLKFEQVGSKMQVAAVGWAYGACLADLDNDGFLDLYATAGYISRNRTEPDG